MLEDNAVGTHEFFDLVEMLGADAYVNGNLGTGTPQEMAEWLSKQTGQAVTAVNVDELVPGLQMVATEDRAECLPLLGVLLRTETRKL